MNEYAKWADESHTAWMRRVDIFVAEEVMGWKRGGKNDRTSPRHTTRKIKGKDAEPYDDFSEKGSHDYLTDPSGGVYYFCCCGDYKESVSIPHYSTQIADAWLVVEKLGKLTGKDVLVEHCADGERLCTLGWHYRGIWMKDIQEKADTAPLAICLAALEAVK